MDSTRQHLLRVSDIIGEIEGRLRSLRLQAQKAERYKRYKAELKDLDLWSSAQRYLGHLAEEKSLGERARDVREQPRGGERPRWRRARPRVEAERLAVTEEATELAAAKDELFALSNKAQLGMQRAEHHDAEAAELVEPGRRRAQGDRRSCARGRPIAGGEHRGDRRRAWPRSTRPRTRSERDYEEQARLQDERRAALAEARRALDDGAGARSRPRARASPGARPSGRARCSAATIWRRGWRASPPRRRRPASGSRRSSARSAGCATRSTASAARVERGARAGGRGRSAPDGRARRDLARRAGARDAARGGAPAALAAGVADRDPGSLRALSEGRSRDHAGAPRRRAAATGSRRVVADIVQPPPELETAVEAVLGERLGNVIVDSHEAGVEAIQFLKRKREGRSSFIPRALRAHARAARPGRVRRDRGAGVR